MVRFTPHAEEEFDILERHGFLLTREQVLATVAEPDRVLPGRRGRLVAEKTISAHYLLRVIYNVHNEDVEVITFYPARRSRYAG